MSKDKVRKCGICGKFIDKDNIGICRHCKKPTWWKRKRGA